MDFGTIGGIIGGLFAIAMGIFFAQGNPALFIDMPSVFITVGGTISSMFTAYPAKMIFSIGSILKNALFSKEEDAGQVIDMLVTFSEKARREGLLALEDDVEEVQDTFLKKGIQLVVDGTDPELVKNILMADLNNIESRHEKGIDMLKLAASIAPAFGMIGTLIGLILMLQNLEDKSAIGPGMSAALLTTMYGSVMANWFFIPLANKLDTNNNKELLLKEIMIEGTLSIQSGDNPRIVKDKLASYLPPVMREQIGEEED